MKKCTGIDFQSEHTTARMNCPDRISVLGKFFYPRYSTTHAVMHRGTFLPKINAQQREIQFHEMYAASIEPQICNDFFKQIKDLRPSTMNGINMSCLSSCVSCLMKNNFRENYHFSFTVFLRGKMREKYEILRPSNYVSYLRHMAHYFCFMLLCYIQR